MLAAGVFEGAQNESAATVILHVVRQILPGDVGCAALVWALDRKARAVVLVVLLGRRGHCSCEVPTDCTSDEGARDAGEITKRGRENLLLINKCSLYCILNNCLLKCDKM